MLGKINLLFDVDKHYKRKEEVYFPILEKYSVIGPTQVMWGVDDEIRAALRSIHARLLSFDGRERPQISLEVKELLQAVKDMIYKEEKILIPITEEHFTTDEWSDIHLASEEIGYCLVAPDAGWVPRRTGDSEAEEVGVKRGIIRLPTGTFSVDQLELILNTLPVDITFVDENDEVRYFSDSAERIFTRPRTIIGRNVRNCHPPASVHVVEEIIDSFRQGTRDVAEFWIRMGDKYVCIRYLAVRDREGAYRGTLEVSQEISGIKSPLRESYDYLTTDFRHGKTADLTPNSWRIKAES